MTAIETDGLTKRFGDVTAVDDLSLSIDGGEVFGFLGPNGAGKSTTINLLLGFLSPTAGSVTVLGRDVTTDGPAVREGVGLLTEEFAALSNLTGREHVASAIATKGADQDPDDLLDRVGLDAEDARRPAGEYSTGMHQRLGLAIALVGRPDLIVLDEPTSGLDPNGVQLLRRIVRREADRGATVFFSSHVLDEVERVCDRVGILRSGELVAVDDVARLRERLGEGATVEATVDDPGALDRETLSSVEGVADVAIDGDTVRIDCQRAAAKMPALDRLEAATAVTDVTVQDASLEALFEQYTSGPGPSNGGPGRPGGRTDAGDTAGGATGGTSTRTDGGGSRGIDPGTDPTGSETGGESG